MAQIKGKSITLGNMMWNGAIMGISGCIILFLIMDLPIGSVITKIELPLSKLWMLPLAFILTAAPCFWMNTQPFMKKVNEGFNNELFNFSMPKLAIIYAVNCLCEELLFRVAIQSLIAQYIGVPLGIISTSLLFFLFHFRYIKYWQLMISSFWVGIVWGTLYGATDSWMLTALAHFAHNFTLSSIQHIQITRCHKN